MQYSTVIEGENCDERHILQSRSASLKVCYLGPTNNSYGTNFSLHVIHWLGVGLVFRFRRRGTACSGTTTKMKQTHPHFCIAFRNKPSRGAPVIFPPFDHRGCIVGVGFDIELGSGLLFRVDSMQHEQHHRSESSVHCTGISVMNDQAHAQTTLHRTGLGISGRRCFWGTESSEGCRWVLFSSQAVPFACVKGEEMLACHSILCWENYVIEIHRYVL